MGDGYRTTQAAKTDYFIEDVWHTVSPEISKRYAAYWPDLDGWKDKSDRFIGAASTIGELVIYTKLHYPNARLRCIWPPSCADDSDLTRNILANEMPSDATAD